MCHGHPTALEIRWKTVHENCRPFIAVIAVIASQKIIQLFRMFQVSESYRRRFTLRKNGALMNIWLVGRGKTPLKNDGVRQLGWWKQPNITGKIKHGNQTTNQSLKKVGARLDESSHLLQVSCWLVAKFQSFYRSNPHFGLGDELSFSTDQP